MISNGRAMVKRRHYFRRSRQALSTELIRPRRDHRLNRKQ
jgi:hypothetical protein